MHITVDVLLVQSPIGIIDLLHGVIVITLTLLHRQHREKTRVPTESTDGPVGRRWTQTPTATASTPTSSGAQSYRAKIRR